MDDYREEFLLMGYLTLGTCATLQCHFYYAMFPYRCIHESLLELYQLSNYYCHYCNNVFRNEHLKEMTNLDEIVTGIQMVIRYSPSTSGKSKYIVFSQVILTTSLVFTSK